jgi:transcription initiation factor TFIID TATA-box-binding protein
MRCGDCHDYAQLYYSGEELIAASRPTINEPFTVSTCPRFRNKYLNITLYASNMTSVSKDAEKNAPSQHAPSLAGSVIEATVEGGEKLLLRIQNMSSTANLGVPLDLKKIALKCRNTEFNPRRFGAVIMRLREPRATALLFRSGKMVISGTKSTHNATLATKKFAYILERVGFQPKPEVEFKVQNVVASCDLGFPIRLEGLVFAHSAFCSYEPELFPGLIYRLVSPRVVFLIFVSGKIVITGAKKETDLSSAMIKMYPVLVEYKKTYNLALNPPPVKAAGSETGIDVMEEV